jgi:hypothetical protein
MRDNAFRIPVVMLPDAKIDDCNPTHIELSVSHYKERKFAWLYVGPVTVSDGWEKRRIDFGRSHVMLEPMPRLNRKRLPVLLEGVKREIENKSGPAYDLFLEVMGRNKCEPAPEPAAVAV